MSGRWCFYAVGLGKDACTKLFEHIEDAVPLGRIAHLLRAGVDTQLGPQGYFFLNGLFGYGRCAGEVFVRRIGTRSDQPPFDLTRPIVLVEAFFHAGQGRVEIGGEGAVEMRLQLVEVDFDELVVKSLGLVINFRVGTQILTDFIGKLGYFLTPRSFEIALHRIVIGKVGGGSSHFGAHVADGALAGSRNRLRTLAKVLDDGPRTALYGQNTRYFQDDIFWSSPVLKSSLWESVPIIIPPGKA